MTWVLVMYIYAGTLANGDSVTISTVDNFKTEASCKRAGPYGEKLVSLSSKSYRFVCMPKE